MLTVELQIPLSEELGSFWRWTVSTLKIPPLVLCELLLHFHLQKNEAEKVRNIPYMATQLASEGHLTQPAMYVLAQHACVPAVLTRSPTEGCTSFCSAW